MIKTRLVGLLSHAKKYIVYIILWQWLGLWSQIGIVFTIAGLIEDALYGSLSGAGIARAAVILVICAAVRFVCEKMGADASYHASADVKGILRRNIYEKMLRLGASYREQVATSEVTQLSTEGVDQLETYFSKYLPQLFYSLLAPITLFIVLCRISMRASVALLICVPLIPISIVVVQKIAKRLLNKYWSIYTGLGDSFLENLQGLTTLKVYQADAQKAVEMDEESANFRRITMKVLTMQLNSTSVMDIVAYGGAAVGMIMVLQQFLNGKVGVEGTIAIILLAAEFFLPLRRLGSYFHIAMNGMAASDKMFRILDLPEPEAGTEEFPENGGDVEFKDVHFSYDGEREILKGIDLSFPKGSFTAIAGESGCGKSTVASIITGMNRGYGGEITVGGVQLKDINEADLNRHVVIVRHDSSLFKGTVEENLRMAGSDLTEEQMRAALAEVNLLNFLDTQEGLKTRLLEGGMNLSGGQRQRLCLARALLRDGDIYIFDEATSNIDVESEDLIMKTVMKLAGTKTVIVISHRLANVVGADRIYLIDEGRIAEEGTHAELLAADGVYSRLYRRQSELENYGKGAL